MRTPQAPLGWLLGIAAIVAASRVNAGDPPTPTVTVQRHIVLGAPGEPQLVLFAEDGAAGVRVTDAKGKERLSIEIRKGGAKEGPLPYPTLSLIGEEDGYARMTVGPSGTMSLDLSSGTGLRDPSVHVWASKADRSSDGHPSASLRLDAGFQAGDPSAAVIVRRGDASSSASLSLFSGDEGADPRVGLGAHRDLKDRPQFAGTNLARSDGAFVWAYGGVGWNSSLSASRTGAALSCTTDEKVSRPIGPGFGPPGFNVSATSGGTDLGLFDLAGSRRVGIGSVLTMDKDSLKCLSPGSLVVFDEEGKPVWRAPATK